MGRGATVGRWDGVSLGEAREQRAPERSAPGAHARRRRERLLDRVWIALFSCAASATAVTPRPPMQSRQRVGRSSANASSPTPRAFLGPFRTLRSLPRRVRSPTKGGGIDELPIDQESARAAHSVEASRRGRRAHAELAARDIEQRSRVTGRFLAGERTRCSCRFRAIGAQALRFFALRRNRYIRASVPNSASHAIASLAMDAEKGEALGCTGASARRAVEGSITHDLARGVSV